MDTVSGGKAIEKLVVQYEETDWEFMKRLASHFHASILPASEFGAPKIYFGLKKGKEAGDLTKLSYTAEKRISGYKQFSANGYPDYNELDAISFGITSGLYYEPGSSLTFQGIPYRFIFRIRTRQAPWQTVHPEPGTAGTVVQTTLPSNISVPYMERKSGLPGMP